MGRSSSLAARLADQAPARTRNNAKEKTMTNVSVPDITLNDGTTLPAIGFGTYRLNGSVRIASIVSGIKAGYRLLDFPPSTTRTRAPSAKRSDVRAFRARNYA